MTRTRKVTSIPGTYSFEGKSYGPFEAANGKDFKEVPADFADALGLPLHESEVQAQAEQHEDEDGADVQELLDANASLKSSLDTVTAERDDLRAKLEEADSEISFLKLGKQDLNTQLEKARAAIEANTAALDAAVQAASTIDTGNPVTESTPLPEDFPMRSLLLESGFDSLEKVRAGLVKPDGAEKSPVEDINGIGKKTVDAITAALG